MHFIEQKIIDGQHLRPPVLAVVYTTATILKGKIILLLLFLAFEGLHDNIKINL